MVLYECLKFINLPLVNQLKHALILLRTSSSSGQCIFIIVRNTSYSITSCPTLLAVQHYYYENT